MFRTNPTLLQHLQVKALFQRDFEPADFIPSMLGCLRLLPRFTSRHRWLCCGWESSANRVLWPGQDEHDQGGVRQQASPGRDHQQLSGVGTGATNTWGNRHKHPASHHINIPVTKMLEDFFFYRRSLLNFYSKFMSYPPPQPTLCYCIKL